MQTKSRINRIQNRYCELPLGVQTSECLPGWLCEHTVIVHSRSANALTGPPEPQQQSSSWLAKRKRGRKGKRRREEEKEERKKDRKRNK
jgi:hypothetical protein